MWGVSRWKKKKKVACEVDSSLLVEEKKIIWLPQNLTACVQVSEWLTALSPAYYLTLWVTVGEEKDKMTGFGLDLCHVSIGILQVVLTALSVTSVWENE